MIRAFLENGLAGCANLYQMESQYFWKEALCKQAEVLVIFKTIPKNEIALRKALEEMHPYEVPCVLSWQVDANSAYSDWISGNHQIKDQAST